MSIVTPRSLYRLQLATARLLDTTPGLKSLLSLALPPAVSPHPLARIALNYFLTGVSPTAAPSAAAAAAVYTPVRSLSDFVRREWRSGEGSMEVGVSIQQELTRLCDISTVFSNGVHGKASAFDPKGLHSRAGELLGGASLAEADSIRPGVLLLDHPSTLGPGRGVTLVYDIARGVKEVEGHENWVLRGFQLNRPYPHPLSTIAPGLSSSLGPLASFPVFHGGGDGDGGLFVLHKFPNIPGAVSIDGPPSETERVSERDSLSQAPSGLYLGGELDGILEVVSSGRGSMNDFRFLLGHVEVTLTEDEQGGLSLPSGMSESTFLLAAGPGVAAHALLPPLFDSSGPYAGGVGLKGGGSVVGYNFGRFWHQNTVWGCAVRELGAWIETENRARGREISEYSSPASHAAVAHYFAAGLTAQEVSNLESQGFGSQP